MQKWNTVVASKNKVDDSFWDNIPLLSKEAGKHYCFFQEKA